MYLRTINNFLNYAITEDGEIWSKKYERLLKPSTINGYKQIGLWADKKLLLKLVHRLVLETFVGKCPKNMIACHNNGIRNDNRLENLRWDTRSNNTIDSIKQGTFANSKLTIYDILQIRRLYRTKKYSQQKIAEAFGIGYTTVNYIVNYKTWKHIE